MASFPYSLHVALEASLFDLHNSRNIDIQKLSANQSLLWYAWHVAVYSAVSQKFKFTINRLPDRFDRRQSGESTG
jgi:hypothetical protein